MLLTTEKREQKHQQEQDDGFVRYRRRFVASVVWEVERLGRYRGLPESAIVQARKLAARYALLTLACERMHATHEAASAAIEEMAEMGVSEAAEAAVRFLVKFTDGVIEENQARRIIGEVVRNPANTKVECPPVFDAVSKAAPLDREIWMYSRSLRFSADEIAQYLHISAEYVRSVLARFNSLSGNDDPNSEKGENNE